MNHRTPDFLSIALQSIKWIFINVQNRKKCGQLIPDTSDPQTGGIRKLSIIEIMI